MTGENTQMRWTADQAWQWHDERPLPCGFNYVPRTAVNSLEMWQADTWDPQTIAQELGWAQDLGMNACRVYLPFLLWRHDAPGLSDRLSRFLEIAAERGLSALLVLFDDCDSVGRDPVLGPQGEPVPGVHNSRWTPSPGHREAEDRALWPALEAYVTALVGRWGRDERVLAWDIYNEPGQSGMGVRSLPLLHAAFSWARAAKPSQPLTAAIYSGPPPSVGRSEQGSDHPDATLSEAMLAESDIISFHDYGDLAHLEAQIAALQTLGRPLLCTEWLCRPLGSLVETHLPVLLRERVGSYFWGLVNGRTQTQFPWGSPPNAPEPALWFHDLLRGDGTPYAAAETSVFQNALIGPQSGEAGRHRKL